MTAAPTAASASAAHDAIVAALAQSTKHRRYSGPVVRWLMTNDQTRDKGRAIANCALMLKLEAAQGLDEPPEAGVIAARVCNARLCPYCEWRRARVQRARLLTGAAALLEAEPRLVPLMLTLTLRNVPMEGLRPTFDQLHKAWNNLTKRESFPTRLWYRRTEVTVSTPEGRAKKRRDGRGSESAREGKETGEVTLHPHLHCLLFVSPAYFGRRYIKQDVWAENWRQCLGIDYTPVVDVRRAYGKDGEKTSASLPLSATMEASKYITKAADLPSLGPLVADFDEAVRGVRMRAVSRDLGRYVSAGDVKASELLDKPIEAQPDGPAALQVIARWCDRRGAYFPYL